MNKCFVILILVTKLNYFYLSPSSSSHKSNLKKVSKNPKEKERKLDDLSDDTVIIHLNDVHCGFNDTIGYDEFVLYRDEFKKILKCNNSGCRGSFSGGSARIYY